MNSTVPMMLVSGFLGSGKTTFINHLLREGLSGKRIAIIVNDFGSISVDDSLISHPDDSMLVLRNGCVCCSLAGDLTVGLSRLLDDADFDMLVMESAGISKVDAIRKVLEGPSEKIVTLALVVIVVDAVRFYKMQDAIRTASEQVENAGVILLNRCDVATRGQVEESEAAIHRLNPGVTIVRTSFANASIETVMGEVIVARDAMQRNDEKLDEWVTCELVLTRALDRQGLEAFLLSLPESVARLKGFVMTTGGNVLHVNHVPGEPRIEPWEDPVPAENKNVLTVIGMPGFEKALSTILPDNAKLTASDTLRVDH